MSTTDKKTKKRLLPKPGNKPRETLAESLKAINKQYGKTLEQLAK